MRLLAIDPGTMNLGIAVLDTPATLLWCDTLHADDPGTNEDTHPTMRAPTTDPIVRWYRRIRGYCAKYSPDQLAYELLQPQGRFRGAANEGQLWQQVGMLHIISGAIPCQPRGYTPRIWRRRLTGNQYAGDHEVNAVVAARTGIDLIARYGVTRASHMLDAAGVALIAAEDFYQTELRNEA